MDAGKKIWLDGALLDWNEAQVHILNHSLHYGLAAFEGIRCYKTARGSAVFRLDAHLDRFFGSCKIVQFELPYDSSVLTQVIDDVIRANDYEECYIRPLAFLGYGRMGINNKGIPAQCAVAVWPWGSYLGADAHTKGIRAKVSSFTRIHPNSSMTKAKITGNYANSQLAKREAVDGGFQEAILLDSWGNVAEGSGENIFIVRDGKVATPNAAGILEGITRDSVIRIAKDLGLTVEERTITRDELYLAEEVFFTGTAAEVTPVVEIDLRTIGSGMPGKQTQAIQSVFFRAVRAEEPGYIAWNHFLSPAKAARKEKKLSKDQVRL